MKKKVKLITTIASLGLALALMAFGVYAATQVSFNVSSNVSFTAAAGVYVDASWKVENAAEGNAEKTYSTAATAVGEDEFDLELAGVEFGENNRVITYTFNIANQADAEYTFTVAFTTKTLTLPDTVSAVVTEQGEVVDAGISGIAGAENVEEYTLTIVLTLNDARKSFESTDLAIELAGTLTPGTAVA